METSLANKTNTLYFIGLSARGGSAFGGKTDMINALVALNEERTTNTTFSHDFSSPFIFSMVIIFSLAVILTESPKLNPKPDNHFPAILIPGA
jgi:hypothetical protein